MKKYIWIIAGFSCIALVVFILTKGAYTNNLKNWEFDKEAPQNFCPERATIAERQGTSEDKDFEAKPTKSKTNFLSCLCMNKSKTLTTYDIEEYKEYCLSAAKNDAVFKEFQQHPLFKLLHNENHEQQYVQAASALGDVSGLHIVEIGGGYGFLCKMLSERNKIASYTIIDIPECLALTRKYLESEGIKNVTYLTPTDVKEGNYDLVISCYGFTESAKPLQKKYLKKIIDSCPRGYLVCNFFYQQYLVKPITKENLLPLLNQPGRNLQILPEEPSTGKNNFIAFWKELE